MHILTYGLSADKLAGIETFLLNMNKYMSEDCIFDYVIEISPEMGESTIHQASIDEKGGKIYYIAPKRNMIQNIKDWKKLLKDYRNEYSTVYFNMYSLSWFFPIVLCKNCGMKVVVHAHNNMLHDCGVLLHLLHRMGRWITNKMDIIRVTNSDLSSQFMFGDTKREILIYNAISVGRFGYNEDVRNEIRTKYNSTGKNVYGFAGRVTYQKNPLFLIGLFELIAKEDKEAVLMIAGDGDLIQEVKELIAKKELQNQVILLGSVQNVEEFYQAMDVFLLPSRFEGLGIVLIEAQTAGLPCITSADVVPYEAKATDLLEYVSLKEIDLWAKTAIKMAKAKITREKYKRIIEDSSFNISKEAPHLEMIILELCDEKKVNKLNDTEQSRFTTLPRTR